MDSTLKFLGSNYEFWCDLQLSTMSVILTGTKDVLCPPIVYPFHILMDGRVKVVSFIVGSLEKHVSQQRLHPSGLPFLCSLRHISPYLPRSTYKLTSYDCLMADFLANFFLCQSISIVYYIVLYIIQQEIPSVCSGSFDHTANFAGFFPHCSFHILKKCCSNRELCRKKHNLTLRLHEGKRLPFSSLLYVCKAFAECSSLLTYSLGQPSAKSLGFTLTLLCFHRKLQLTLSIRNHHSENTEAKGKSN